MNYNNTICYLLIDFIKRLAFSLAFVFKKWHVYFTVKNLNLQNNNLKNFCIKLSMRNLRKPLLYLLAGLAIAFTIHTYFEIKSLPVY